MFQISLYIILSLTAITAQPEYNLPVFTYINDGDIESLAEFLSNHDINDTYGLDDINLLTYSILTEQDKIAEFLLEKGADINQKYLGSPPLITAVLQNNLKIIRLLKNAGADLNATDSKGSSALIHAASTGNLPISRYLVRKGANLHFRNPDNDRAYDMAVKSNSPEVANYLRDKFEKTLPDMSDGPFVRWKRNDKILSFYLVLDSTKQIARKVKQSIRASSEPYLLRGSGNDTNTYTLYKNSDISPAEITGVNKILVMGDTHGGYDSLLLFLRKNRIIDDQRHWIWGNGHMVLLGDIFDRGENVTPILWLVYQLEAQAREQGGCVHFILGNHEIMNLLGNNTYIADKYYYLAKKMNISYSWLFNKHTVLGKWLRTRNTIIKIDDKLFVHAGISPRLAFSGMSIDDINNRVRCLINHPKQNPSTDATEKLLLGYNGPFWYRGYFESSRHYTRASYKEVKQILEVYNVSAIMIGHTNVKAISPLYNAQIFSLDVPFYNMEYSISGLLIENDIIYLLSTSGEKVKMK